MLNSGSLFGQVPDFSKVPNLRKGDSASIVYLIDNGVKITDRKVIAWFPKDSLPADQMKEIAGMINTGISSAEEYIGASLPWQVHPHNKPFTFFFRFDRFISHASQAGFVSIPFWRIKDGKAPWLHEVLHEMLYTKTGNWLSSTVSDKEWSENMPLWLFEGLPDYISLQVSLKENLPLHDVFSNSWITNIDSLFVEEIKTNERGEYILSRIGAKGVVPELYSAERASYAPAFYHGSCSFVKFIAGRYGVEVLVKGIAEFRKEQAIIEELTGRRLGDLKAEWLRELKLGK